MRIRKLAWIFIVLAACRIGAAQTLPLSEPEARRLDEAQYRNVSTLPPQQFVHSERLEEMEEQYVAATMGTGEHVTLPPFVYRLSRDGWEIAPPIARIHGSLPSSTVLYIAVSRISGNLYCISGCADTFGEITKLSSERNVEV